MAAGGAALVLVSFAIFLFFCVIRKNPPKCRDDQEANPSNSKSWFIPEKGTSITPPNKHVTQFSKTIESQQFVCRMGTVALGSVSLLTSSVCDVMNADHQEVIKHERVFEPGKELLHEVLHQAHCH